MIVASINHWARVQPQKPAMYYDDAVLDFAGLARSIEATRRFLAGQRLPAGKTAVVLMRHFGESWVAILALRCVGLDTICVNSVEMAQSLNIDNVACLVTLEHEYPAGSGPAPSLPGAPDVVIPTQVIRSAGWVDIDGLSSEPAHVGGHILYTSGTTGNFKKLLFTEAIAAIRIAERVKAYGYTDKMLHHMSTLGLWTAVGYLVPIAVWVAGGGIIINQTQDPFVDFFKFKPTATVLPISAVGELLAPKAGRNTLGDGFALNAGAGYLNSDLAAALVSKVTRNLVCSYGSTEAGVVMRGRYREPGDNIWLTPNDDRAIEIVDEQGAPCGIDESGELRTRIPDGEIDFYLGDAEASAQFFRDGYFYPGDMAVRRADGRVRILGRVSDVLNIQGHKRPVGALEEKLQQFLKVETVCLFSGLNPQGKDELVVAIETDRELTAFEAEQIRLNYAMFERIRVHILPVFPRTEAGMRKVNRQVLRRTLFE